jgi:hypothetical protein
MPLTQPIQYDRPLFVKVPFHAGGIDYKAGYHFPWRELNLTERKVNQLYNNRYVYHNPELETQQEVGDRLEEFDSTMLKKLVDRVNVDVKELTSGTAEYQKKKLKQSKIDDKQRGLIRSYLRRNSWVQERYYTYRDEILQSKEKVS